VRARHPLPALDSDFLIRTDVVYHPSALAEKVAGFPIKPDVRDGRPLAGTKFGEFWKALAGGMVMTGR
jgi:hypothetical protein